jgi:ketosteroid isomerase-like protein
MVIKTTRGLLMLVALAYSAAAQQQPTAASDESAIRALEEKWDAANLKGDAAALDSIFAETFIMTGDDGKVRTKAEVLGELKAGNIQYQAAKTDSVKIILHGDAAVVNGRWRGTYRYQGKAVNLLERFTNFYVRRGGQWRCVASHGSAIK